MSHDPTAALVNGLNVVAIYVTDLERSRTFYEEQLGMTKSGDMPPGLLLAAGDCTVYLEGGREARESPGLKAAGVSACFSAPSVRACWERLEAAGVPVVEPYQQHGDQFAMFRVADPDGHVVEVAGTP
jgi:catechol 2,3-dioxygenase-like lactoylglutathione lyase family enzyme